MGEIKKMPMDELREVVNDPNGWQQYKKLVLNQFEHFETNLERMEERILFQMDKIEVRYKEALLELKSEMRNKTAANEAKIEAVKKEFEAKTKDMLEGNVANKVAITELTVRVGIIGALGAMGGGIVASVITFFVTRALTGGAG